MERGKQQEGAAEGAESGLDLLDEESLKVLKKMKEKKRDDTLVEESVTLIKEQIAKEKEEKARALEEETEKRRLAHDNEAKEAERVRKLREKK